MNNDQAQQASRRRRIADRRRERFANALMLAAISGTMALAIYGWLTA